MASIEVSHFQNLPEDLITKIVPSQEYYHFTHSGSMEYLIHSIYSIYKVWLPEKNLNVKPNAFSKVNHVENMINDFGGPVQILKSTYLFLWLNLSSTKSAESMKYLTYEMKKQ